MAHRARLRKWRWVLGGLVAALAGLGWMRANAPRGPAVPVREPSGFLGGSPAATAVAFAPDGQTIASGGYDGLVRIWDRATRKERSAIRLGSQVAVWPIRFGPAGATVIAGADLNGAAAHSHPPGSYAPALRAWDVATGTERAVLGMSAGDLVRAFHLARDGRTLAVNTVVPPPGFNTLVNTPQWCEQIILWDTATWTERSRVTLGPGGISATAFNDDATLLATATLDGAITLYRTTNGQPTRKFAGRPVARLAFSPDGRTLAGIAYGTPPTGSSLVLWDVESGLVRAAQPLPPSRESPLLAFSPDGRMVATTWSSPRRFDNSLPLAVQRLFRVRGPDSAVFLWSVPDGRPLLELHAPDTSLATELAFSPDGRSVALSHYSAWVTLWNLPDDVPSSNTR
jgi:WD40 repeat protein